MSIKFNFNSFKTVDKKESTRKGNGSVKRVCAFCGKEFITYPWRGDGKYYLKPEIDVHHIDKNGLNNDINNLIPLTRSEHTSIHNNEKTIIRDVDGRIKTVVFKQGELLETHNDNDNQQPSISSNAFKGSTTNSRVQTDNAEDSNADTSALPSINTSDDIV